MSSSRGLPITQARALASNPSTSPAILAQLANSYPETWELILANPSTYPDLREWLEHSLGARIMERPPVKVEELHLNETVQVVPLIIEPEPEAAVAQQPEPVLVVVESAPAAASQKESPLPVKRRKSRRARKNSTLRKVLSIGLPPLAIIVVCALVTNIVISSIPETGSISVENLTSDPAGPIWSQEYSQGENAECVTFSAKTFDQNLAVILVQNDESEQDCRDLETPPETKLSLLNTQTGQEIWKKTLADQLPWTEDWKKEIIEAPGLNEILIRFIDVNSDDVDKDKTLVAYNRLTGLVADPVIAAQKDKPQQAAPVLEVTMIPGNTKDIIVFTNAPDDEDKKFQLMRFRAKQLSKSKWKFKTDLKPIGGNPIVNDRIVLGRVTNSDESVLAEAVTLDKGKKTSWAGRPGGKIVNVGDNYIRIQGDGVDDEFNNEISQAGTEDSDGSGTPITLTGISSTGDKKWEKAVEGYALSRFGDYIDPFNKSTYNNLFEVRNGRTEAMAISASTGDDLWAQPLSLGDFLISKISSQKNLFSYKTAEGADFAGTVEGYNLASGSMVGSQELANDNTRIDGVSSKTGYIVDDPKRSEAEDKKDSEDNNGVVAAEEDDDPEEMKKVRTCFTAFDLASFETLFTYQCNGYEHAVLLGGNWVILDRTPEKQVIRSFAQHQ